MSTTVFGKTDQQRYESAADVKQAVAGLLAAGHRVWWSPAATKEAYHAV